MYCIYTLQTLWNRSIVTKSRLTTFSNENDLTTEADKYSIINQTDRKTCIAAKIQSNNACKPIAIVPDFSQLQKPSFVCFGKNKTTGILPF